MEKFRNKVILVRPRPDKRNRYEVTAPLALLSIAEPLLKNGFDVKIIDAITLGNYKDVIKKEAADALCVCISTITGYAVLEGLDISKEIKETYPEVPTVWGGWLPSIIPRETVEHPYVDISARGMGEVTFLELCQALRDNHSLAGVKGIMYKDKSGNVIENEKRHAKEVKGFGPLPYHLIDIEKYIRKTHLGERTIDYRSSTGCPHRCTFCCDVVMSDRKWVALEATNVVDEIEDLVNKYQVDSLLMLENEFFTNHKRVRAICEGLIERNIKVKFGNVNVRPDEMAACDPELLELMAKAGIVDFLAGVESGSQEILDRVQKRANAEDTIKMVENLDKYNMRAFLSFVCGFPFDDIPANKQLDYILDHVQRCLDINNRQKIYISIYLPYPGTALYEECLARGDFKIPKTLEEWGYFELDTTFQNYLDKKTEHNINMLNNYILQYTSNQFSEHWDKLYSGRLKQVKKTYHKTLMFIAKYRLKKRFFALPLEYKLLEWTKNRKAKAAREKLELSSQEASS